ncbi:hypothetical protein L9F63_028161 [Diploptera punctata]|uniref:L-Fucosyltransferase n=1 Tax=Diploptera punctata TaxID=6984 RepID=A0AAD8EFL1_DIPPU|nr:hypothetical protein L9F63_028161 [Diploptera punctata]
MIPIYQNFSSAPHRHSDTFSKIDSSVVTKKCILESSVCFDKHVHNNVEVATKWRYRCPDKAIVTVEQGGRLGNQMWEYASVWVVAKATNREPFVPSCIIHRLTSVFKNVTKIPPLKYIKNCPVNYETLNETQMEKHRSNNSIILPRYIQFTKLVARHLNDTLKLFEFQDHLTKRVRIY